ncbi:hypothetical protein BCY91_12245 [Pelobium manganitolerans]|uniref:Methyltransferase FkbM domain-containing protein n=1 Tax=Pelobium manganitolerans TaxID=1842495 RepID=A0A419S1Q1_9SPHI|nr:FkbM family methyltransferase [Pelobium manganitolerans]RKD12414.1 hypothetical protein BCY91_12245 [Pelobium manganitolerans]
MKHFFRCFFSSIKNFENRFWLPKDGNLTETLDDLSKRKPGISILQLGANDGVNNDPYFDLIKKYNWHGILVEPQPNVFKRLLANYENRNHHLNFANYAVSDKKGVKTMFYLDVPNQTWADGLTSFSKSNILAHIDNGYIEQQLSESGFHFNKEEQLKLIKEIQIECKTVEDIMKDNGLQQVDIIAMDLEGYDHVIVNNLNLNRLTPEIVVYESKYVDFELYKRAVKHLRKYNYTVYKDGQDIFAIRNG